MAFGFSNNNSNTHKSRLNDWFNTGSTIGNGAMSYASTGNTPWGAIAKGAKGLYGLGTGHNDSNYSDLEEGIIYPAQGAAIGTSIMPGWGTLGGALYGLGYAFKDDLGLKDNNWFTTMTFPIGMGDEHKGIIQL